VTTGVGAGGGRLGAVEQAAASKAKLAEMQRRTASRIESVRDGSLKLAAAGFGLNVVAQSLLNS
jgi:hypothetical protein